MVESLLFIGAGAGVKAGEKIPRAGQKRTGKTLHSVSLCGVRLGAVLDTFEQSPTWRSVRHFQIFRKLNC